MPAKAALAQVLLERAWAAAPPDGPAPRPWPWADTRPIARLHAPVLEQSVIVLAGAHGRSFAFGPGHMDETALPGTRGHSVVAAHRDTHFAFLKRVAIGDEIVIERPGGDESLHVVVHTEIIDTRTETIRVDDDTDMITLVTCYPFDDWAAGGPLRYIVHAVRV